MAKALKAPTGRIAFYCPGCNTHHAVDETWAFNGDYEKPTFSPSVLVRSGHYSDSFKGDCWCTYYQNHPEKNVSFKCLRCHSFVRDGKIEYLSDCSHELRGQTIDLPDIE